MKKIYTLVALLISFSAGAQTTLYSNDFSGGSTGWSLGSTGSGFDIWIVNGIYNCAYPTPDAGGGNYLHVYNDFDGDKCATSAFYGAGSGGTAYATMTTGFTTVGYSTVTISFSWLCAGQTGFILPTYGNVEYSINGGTNWTQFTNPINAYSGKSTWQSVTITSTAYPAIANVADLRFRFKWVSSGYGNNPAFAIDNLLVTGTGSACTNVGGTATIADNLICAGQTDTVTVTGSTGTIQWQVSSNGSTGWANVTGGSGATTTQYITGALTGPNYFRAVVSEVGCPDQYSNTVFVLANNPPVVVVHTPDTIKLCTGDNTSINLGAVGNNLSYQWYLNSGSGYQTLADGGSYSGTKTSTLTITSATTTAMYKCIVKTGGCTATDEDSTLAIVQPSVNPSVTISASTSSICTGGCITFATTTTNGGTLPQYQWRLNGVFISGANNDSLVTCLLNNGDMVDCILTSSQACLLKATDTSNSISITVLPLLTASISISSSTSTICAGGCTKFNAAIVNGGASPQYQWRINGTPAGTNNDTLVTCVLSNGDQVDCILTSNQTCVLNTTDTSNGISSAVIALVTPSVAVALAPGTRVCEGTCINFSASPVNGGIPSYQWQLNGLDIPGATMAAYTNCAFTDGDVVSCVMTSNLTCLTQPGDTVTLPIQIDTIPVVTLTVPSLVCQSSSPLSLTGGSPTGGTYSGPGVTGSSFDASQPVGLYSINYNFVDNNGCEAFADDTLALSVCTGADNLTNDHSITVYPNPSGGLFNIHVNEDFVSIEIYSVEGKLITTPVSKEHGLFTVNLSQQAKGIYLLRIVTLRGVETRKLVVE